MFECCDVLVGDVDEYGLVERDAIGYRLDIFSGNQPFPVCIDRLDTEKAVAVIKQFHKNGEAPLVRKFHRDAYKRVSDTLGIERYQSVPLYLPEEIIKTSINRYAIT